MNISKVPRRKLPRTKVVDRDSHIIKLCRNKKILHIGCSDAPYTREKYERGILLHIQIAAVASQAAGIDVDADSVQWLVDKGMQNIYRGDAAKIEDLLPKIGFEPELIIAGEVLEHLSQPLDFLCGIKKAMRNGAELVFSVPNAYWFEGFVHVLLGREKVHPEHVAYYSYHTILQLMERASLEVTALIPCKYNPTSLQTRISDLAQVPITWISPHFAPGYVVVAVRVAK